MAITTSPALTAGYLKREIYALFLACRDPRVPWYAKALGGLIVGYAFSPIDLIPDFIPVHGHLDDVVVIPLGVMAMRRMIPAPVLAECRDRAGRLEGRTRSRLAVMVIVVLWLALAVAGLHWLAPWYELGEVVATTALCVLVSLWLWLVLARPSRTIALRQALDRRGAANVLWALGGLCMLFIAAEGVLDRRSEELLRDLDGFARHASQLLAASRLVHSAASRLTDLTGIGLVTAVGGVALCLLVLRHRREAAVVVFGSLSAWALSGALKLAFGVPRPHSFNEGFPSGHVVVVVVGCGLMAWCLGRLADSRTRRALYAAAAATALFTGTARLILDAHWLSDVIGGLAAGMVWLNVVILLASWLSPEERARGEATISSGS